MNRGARIDRIFRFFFRNLDPIAKYSLRLFSSPILCHIHLFDHVSSNLNHDLHVKIQIHLLLVSGYIYYLFLSFFHLIYNVSVEKGITFPASRRSNRPADIFVARFHRF